MDKIRVDGANGLRFSTRRKGYFTPGTGSPFSGSFVTSASETILRVPQIGINPNKAVFTIDSKSSQILIVNNNACELLGYTPKELCDMLFSTLLTNKNKSHVSALAEGQLNSEDGTMVLLSGKVVEMNTKYATKVAVSLWIRQIDADGRCLAVAEPVERRVAQLLLDRNGCILSGDYEALMLFQLESLENFCGMEIQTLIPAIVLPDATSDTIHIAKHIRKQRATGKTVDGVTFPLCLMITVQPESIDLMAAGIYSSDSGGSSSQFYCITIWVFQNISGLLVIDENGHIESCNHHFSMLMFGYAQSKIMGRGITELIPNFGRDIECINNARSRNATSSSLDNEESETETDPVYYENDGFISSASEYYNQSVAIANSSMFDELGKTKPEVVNMSMSGGQSSTMDTAVKTTSVSSTNLSSRSNLLNENGENNKNVANWNKSLGGSGSGATTSTANKSSVGAIIFKNDISGCDLMTSGNGSKYNYECSDMMLTPVNEAIDYSSITNHSIVSIPSAVDHQLHTTASKFCSMDSVEIIQFDSPVNATTEMNKSIATPKCNPTSNDGSSIKHSLLTSTPDVRRFSAAEAAAANAGTKAPAPYNDGKYKGEAIHCDGNVLDILYTISSQVLPCGRRVFCVWICRDPDLDYELDDDDGRLQNLTLTFNSITSTIENSLGQAIKTTAAQNSSRPNSVSLLSQCEDDQVNGEFVKHYTTLKQIGKGAYGYVKMAYRHTDHLLVVTKFILKDKLTPQFMIMTEDKKDIPMEIYLLTTVKHPNIVTVYDVFENEKFYQLVMEKHGSGMDLFEFIDRRPMMDEKLGCFIFHQIANAVDYLHSLHILHRDIKDENIIIDHNFHVKLIDFGSATFMEEGKLFSTFYGTTEYCSPEVLAGNKYAGPELEMWSLGVTLYVLMFFENPFLDIEETLRAELSIPSGMSQPLEVLLISILDKNPKTRCTMRQLQANEWINQEINPATFNFAWIVPCEAHEANPEKFFTGPVYSSTTALSTMSPQDSLSLVDEDSMIDPEEDIEQDVAPADVEELELEEEVDDEEDEKSLPSQDDQLCGECVSEPISGQQGGLGMRLNSQTDMSCMSLLQSEAGTSSHLCTNKLPYNETTSIPVAGKPIVNKSTLHHQNHHQNQHNNSSLTQFAPLTRSTITTTSTNCTKKLSAIATPTTTTAIAKRKCDDCVCSVNIHTNTSINPRTTITPTNKATMSSTLNSANANSRHPKHSPVSSKNPPIPRASKVIPSVCLDAVTVSSFTPQTRIICQQTTSSMNYISNNTLPPDIHVLPQSPEYNNKINNPADVLPSDSNLDTSIVLPKDLNAFHLTINSNNVPGMHSLSKSETNIFAATINPGTRSEISPSKLAVFNVVSLNNLHESEDSFESGRPMNDLSKNQFLNNISNDEISSKEQDLRSRSNLMK